MDDPQSIDRLHRALSDLATSEVPPWLATSVVERVRAEGGTRVRTGVLHLAFASIAVLAVVALAVAALPLLLPPNLPGQSIGALPTAIGGLPTDVPTNTPESTTATPTVTPTPQPSESAPASPTPSPSITPSLPPLSRTITATSEAISGPLSPRFNASGVWTGTELIIWGGSDALFSDSAPAHDDGAAYDPSTGTWRMIADGPLEARRRQLAAWTGSEMLVWGGDHAGSGLGDGAAYDPATDTWRRIVDGPLAWTLNAAGVWTGTEWVLGRTDRQGGIELLELAAYDPEGDAWRTLPSLEASIEAETSLVWTGAEVVALGSSAGLQRLSLSSRDWLPVTPIRLTGNLVWAGARVMGITLEYLGIEEPRYRLTLAAWDPASDSWELLQDPAGNLPDYRLISADGRVLLLTGELVFDVGTGEWWSMNVPANTDHRLGAVEVWLGDRLAIWGGGDGDPATAFDEGVVIVPHW